MNKYKAFVKVMPQREILDPQGKAVEQALNQMGLNHVADLRIGKNIEFELMAENQEAAMVVVREAAGKLLANPIMESFELKIEAM